MFEQDYIMRQIRQLAKMVAKFFFNIEPTTLTEELEDRLSENETGILRTLIEMIDAGDICKAEDMLFEIVEAKENGYIETALLFYDHLDSKSDEFLLLNNFSREEVLEGLREVVKTLGLDDVFA